MIRVASVVLVSMTACSGGGRTAEPAASTAPHAAVATESATSMMESVTVSPVEPCPFGLTLFLRDSYWVHELFPSCSPAPFPVDGIRCDGSCPMPCRETHRSLGGGQQGWQRTFTYVDARLATVRGSTDAASVYTKRWDDACAYRDGHLVSCTTPKGDTRIERDGQGRITAVDAADPEEELKVTYGDDGRIATLIGRQGYLRAALRYDAAGRLVAEDELRKSGSTDFTTRYGYDRDGRVNAVTLGDQRRTYAPSTGLLVEQSEVVAYRNDIGRRSTRFRYDEQRRPTRIVIELGDDDALEYVYEYDCAGR